MRVQTLLLFTCSLIAFSAWQAKADPSISGYFNFEYIDPDGADPAYDMHHFNIMVGHEVGKFRLFAEVEFEHAPEVGEEATRGGVLVERAWGEYNLNPYFNVRMGQMLNGTLYQQNHYPNLTNNITRPQMVKKIFSGDLEGLRFFGSVGYGFHYEVESGQEVDATAAKHMTYALKHEFASQTLRTSVAARLASYTPAGGGDAVPASGIEVNVAWNALTLWAESGVKKNDSETTNLLGTYAILSYKLDLGSAGHISPFVMYDAYQDKNVTTDAIVKTGYGLNYQPEPEVSIKLEGLSTGEYTNLDTSKVAATSQWALAFVYFYN